MLKLPAIAVLGTLLACGTASASWSFTGWEPSKCDLVVVGTLSNFEGGLALAHGAVYDTALATITVERVVYAQEGADVPARIQLYSGQHVGAMCARVSHAAHLNERGTWLLTRTAVPGVYTAYRPTPMLSKLPKAEAPQVRVAAAWLDEESAVVHVTVRYENQSPKPVTFPAGHFVVEGWDKEGSEATFSAPGSSRSSVSVSAGRFMETTLQFPLPETLKDREFLVVRSSKDTLEEHRGRLVQRRRAGKAVGSGFPLWLAPEAKTTSSVRYPGALLLLVGALTGLLPLTTGRGTWRWRPWSLRLGTLAAASTLSLVPWAALGLFGPSQVIAGFGVSVVGALVFQVLIVRLLRRSTKAYRPAIALGSLAPVLYVVGSYVFLLASAHLGVA